MELSNLSGKVQGNDQKDAQRILEQNGERWTEWEVKKKFFLKRKHKEKIFEDITAKNFPNLGKETDLQDQEAQRVLNKVNPKKSTSRHSKIKMAKIKDKERILKQAKKKQLVKYRAIAVRLWAYFFFFFQLPCTAWGILTPQPGIKPVAPAVEAQSSNFWTTRELPRLWAYFSAEILQARREWLSIFKVTKRGLGETTAIML